MSIAFRRRRLCFLSFFPPGCKPYGFRLVEPTAQRGWKQETKKVKKIMKILLILSKVVIKIESIH
jgi:hypothetical protein